MIRTIKLENRCVICDNEKRTSSDFCRKCSKEGE